MKKSIIFKSLFASALVAVAAFSSAKSNSTILELLSDDVPSYTENMDCPPAGQVCVNGGCGEDECTIRYKTEAGIVTEWGGAGASLDAVVSCTARSGGYACCFFTYNAIGLKTGVYARAYDSRCCSSN